MCDTPAASAIASVFPEQDTHTKDGEHRRKTHLTYTLIIM